MPKAAATRIYTPIKEYDSTKLASLLSVKVGAIIAYG
jgi:hypothetical protein